LGIPTLYIQHASVTNEFPPLTFKYALLDGKDALYKYIEAGVDSSVSTRIFLIGMTKADNYISSINTNETVCSIGVCTNSLDAIAKVDELCDRIRLSFPDITLVLRPHPGDMGRLAIWYDISVKHQMLFSDPSEEHVFSFLSKVDMVIAGDSGVLLEAVLVNVYPLYYSFVQKYNDNYGFVRNGLVQYASFPEQACDVITSTTKYKPYVRDRAKHYCATVGTSYDGISSVVASEIIEGVSVGNYDFMGKWKPIPGLPVEVYELI
jgi:hypothetical protein